MRRVKSRKERLSIYLAKTGVADDGDLIKLEGAGQPISLDAGGSKVSLYIKKDKSNPPPPWTKLFTDSLASDSKDIFGATRNVGAIAIIRCAEQAYLLTFGTGYHLLKTDSVERDFGLRVTLASVDPQKLRSVDKASYDDNPLNSRTQSTTEVDIFELQMDSDLEMLYAVTGVSRVRIFGSQITGRDALNIAVDTNLDGIPLILEEAYRRYASPLPKEFEWADNVRRVKDANLLKELDASLERELSIQKNATLWLGEPEVVDWERQIGYSFDLHSKTPRHAVLKLDDLIAYLHGSGKSLTIETLRSQNIHINNAEYISTHTWEAYRCLYAEMEFKSDRYMLRNGIWFRVEPDFVAAVDDYVDKIEQYSGALPIYAFDREDKYNEALAEADKTFTLMDKKNTKLGGRYDKIEFCDLIRDGTELIHVKYYRSSGTLSHLFAQGFVAAEAFAKDEDFRCRLNEKLPACMKLTDPKERLQASNYKIVYAIATIKALPKELPFFSKVTLRNAMRTLRALGYNVQIASIEIDPMILAMKSCRPKDAPKRKKSK